MTSPNSFKLNLPTEQACNDFKFKRWPSAYSPKKSSSGYFNQLANSLIDTSTPEFDGRFLSGPQFENKPANIGQQLGAQYSFGYYNGDTSKWFESKTDHAKGQIQSAEMNNTDRTHLANCVIVEILTNSVPKIKNEKSTANGNASIITTTYQSGNAPEIIGEINILPNLQDEGIGFDHAHSFNKQDDIITNLLSGVAGIFAGATTAVAAVTAVVAGQVNANARSGVRPVTKIDIADSYQGTDKLSITIPFTLFTKNDFIRDIFGPIMLLNVISHPKRTNVRIAEDLIKILRNGNSLAMEAGFKGALTASQLNVAETAITNGADNALDIFNSIMPGFRIFSSAPPSYVNVRHSTGIFNLKNCAITNFSYRYKGPWVCSDTGNGKDGGSENNPGEFANPSGEHRPWWKFWLPKADIMDHDFHKVGVAWPSYADCSITFKSVDPVFADDWASLLEQVSLNAHGEKGNIADGVVTVTEKNSPTSSVPSSSPPIFRPVNPQLNQTAT